MLSHNAFTNANISQEFNPMKRAAPNSHHPGSVFQSRDPKLPGLAPGLNKAEMKMPGFAVLGPNKYKTIVALHYNIHMGVWGRLKRPKFAVCSSVLGLNIQSRDPKFQSRDQPRDRHFSPGTGAVQSRDGQKY